MIPPELPGAIRKNDALFMFGAVQKKPFVFAYAQDRVEVVGGPSCKEDREVHTDRCIDDGIAFIERRGGGGTVVLAPGMVITVIVGERPTDAGAVTIFNSIHRCMINLLESAGVNGIVCCGISDLAIGNRKILGSSLYMGTSPNLYYYQSSLLVNPDLGLLGRYLRYPPREPHYRQGRDHSDFCTSLADADCTCTPETLCGLFNRQFGDCLQKSGV